MVTCFQDDSVSDMRYKVQCIDEEIRRVVRDQTGEEGGEGATEALMEAQQAIMQLFSQVWKR